MLRKLKGLVALGSAWSVMAGCASVNPSADYGQAGDRVRGAVGGYETYDPAREAELDRRVEEIVADGLSLEEAVQAALLNNPSLRATYASVGMARADVVQSKLLANPVLGLSLQLPEAGGRANLQASLAQSIVELWQIPVRTKAAERAMDEAILRLADEAARLAIEAKMSYCRAVGMDGALAIARENRALAEKLVDVARARQQAGAVGELDVNLARGTLLTAELDVTQARLDASTARRTLATVLGLTLSAESLILTSGLEESSVGAVKAENVVSTALASRLDLQAADRAVSAAASRVEFEYAQVFPEVSLGVMLERGERRAQKGRKPIADTLKASVANGAFTAPDIQSRGERNLETRSEIDAILGPSLSLELPIFDQNQAQIAKARYEFEQAAKTYEALRRSVVQEARQAADSASTARDVAKFYEDSLLPQVEKSLELSRATYEAGRTSLVTVLEAQQALLGARRASVAAKQSAAVTAAALERVAGRPMAGLLNPTIEPASPASEP